MLLAEHSPAVAAQQAVLSKQLHELKELRHTMQAMYDASQQELVEVRAQADAAQAEAAQERERAAATMVENASLRQWNEQLSADLQRLLAEARAEAEAPYRDAGHEAEEAEAAHLLDAAAATNAATASASAATGISVDISVVHKVQLEASAIALRLTHAKAHLKRKAKELRASTQHAAQLQQMAQALSADLANATAQIGKFEERIRQQAETARKLEQLTAEHEVQGHTLRQTSEALGRAQEEHAALAQGPLAEAERQIAELDARERRSRALLERKVRQAAEMAAAVQTLGTDSRVRIEENVKLRLLAQRLGATPKELELVRRSSSNAARDDGESSDEERSGVRAFDRGESLESAWTRRAAATFGLDHSRDNDEFGSVASTMRPHGYGVHSACRGGECRSSSASSTGSPGAPTEALQSQVALQEKLRKVRSTFADIRRQVGYEE